MASKLKILTPYVIGYDKANPLRAYMQISHADNALLDAQPRVADGPGVEVFDEVSQQSYVVRPADCGGNCFCAAEIVRKGNRTEKHY